MTTPNKKRPPVAPGFLGSSLPSPSKSSKTFGRVLDRETVTLSAARRKYGYVREYPNAKLSPSQNTTNLFQVPLHEVEMNQENAIVGLRRQCQVMRERLDAVENRITNLVEEAAEKDEDHRIFHEGLKKIIETDKNNFNTRINNLETQNGAQQSQIEAQQSQIEAQQSQIEELRAQIEELRAQNAAQQSQIEELRAQVRMLFERAPSSGTGDAN